MAIATLLFGLFLVVESLFPTTWDQSGYTFRATDLIALIPTSILAVGIYEMIRNPDPRQIPILVLAAVELIIWMGCSLNTLGIVTPYESLIAYLTNGDNLDFLSRHLWDVGARSWAGFLCIAVAGAITLLLIRKAYRDTVSCLLLFGLNVIILWVVDAAWDYLVTGTVYDYVSCLLLIIPCIMLVIQGLIRTDALLIGAGLLLSVAALLLPGGIAATVVDEYAIPLVGGLAIGIAAVWMYRAGILFRTWGIITILTAIAAVVGVWVFL